MTQDEFIDYHYTGFISESSYSGEEQDWSDDECWYKHDQEVPQGLS